MSAQTVSLEGGDNLVLQYLGAALVLQWEVIPKQYQDLILQQADSVGGLPAVTSLHAQIKLLLRRERG
jgi:hypothetical protein